MNVCKFQNETNDVDNNNTNIHEKTYMCLYCQYGCNKLKEWKRHVSTNKHLGLIASDIRTQQVFIKDKSFVVGKSEPKEEKKPLPEKKEPAVIMDAAKEKENYLIRHLQKTP